MSSEVNAMITRIFQGQTSRANAAANEELLRTKILPSLRGKKGFKGVYLLRRDVAKGVEFLTMTLWESMDLLRALYGKNYEDAVVPPEARKLLSRFDQKAKHYETVMKLE